MKRKRHTPEQIIRKLREAHGRLADGTDGHEGGGGNPHGVTSLTPARFAHGNGPA